MSKTIQLPNTKDRWTARQIQAVANQLPVSFEERYFHITGKVLRAEREKLNLTRPAEDQLSFNDSAGLPLQDERVYRIAQPSNINHVRRIRRAYNSNGVEGVLDYITWLNDHQAKMLKQFPQFFKMTSAKELIERNKETA